MKHLKSLIIVITVILVLASSFSVSAAPYGKDLGFIPKVNSQQLTIDGDMENVYNYGLKLTTISTTDEEIYADAWLLWDDEYLYMYAKVFDYEIYPEEKANSIESQWYTDSLEIFVDDDNDGKNYPMQYRSNSYGLPSGDLRNVSAETEKELRERFICAAKLFDKGYYVEMRVPCETRAGNKVGIMLQQNGVPDRSWLSEEAVQQSSGWCVADYPYVVLGNQLDESAIEKGTNPTSDISEITTPGSIDVNQKNQDNNSNLVLILIIAFAAVIVILIVVILIILLHKKR